MLRPTSDILDDQKINDVLNGFGNVYGFMQNNRDVLAKIDGAKQVIDAVGEVGPVAHSLACSSRLN